MTGEQNSHQGELTRWPSRPHERTASSNLPRSPHRGWSPTAVTARTTGALQRPPRTHAAGVATIATRTLRFRATDAMAAVCAGSALAPWRRPCAPRSRASSLRPHARGDGFLRSPPSRRVSHLQELRVSARPRTRPPAAWAVPRVRFECPRVVSCRLLGDRPARAHSSPRKTGPDLGVSERSPRVERPGGQHVRGVP